MVKKFDGTKRSLESRSHKPKTAHPNSLDEPIINKILALNRRNPDFSYVEIWVKLRHEGYTISHCSVLRTLQRNGKYKKYESNKKKHSNEYHTPKMVHEKWQADVKHVPRLCKSNQLNDKYYQYTIPDECSRKQFLFMTNEHSMYETTKALNAALDWFGCVPKEIQRDNGFEFTDKA